MVSDIHSTFRFLWILNTISTRRCGGTVVECGVECCLGSCIADYMCMVCLGELYEECKQCWAVAAMPNETFEGDINF